MMSRLKGKSGFTLVEIMIVVAIIGILAAIAVPNFVRARQTAQRRACIANMRQIQGAVVVAQLDGIAEPDIDDDLVGEYIHLKPSCPLGFDVDEDEDYELEYGAGGALTLTCPNNDADTHDVNSAFATP